MADKTLSVICLKCLERHKAECNGRCPCPVDGVDVTVHVQVGRCPAGKYPATTVLKWAIRGAWKYAKSLIGIGHAERKVIAARMARCLSCPLNNGHERQELGACEICGCGLGTKVRLKAEKCPIGRW